VREKQRKSNVKPTTRRSSRPKPSRLRTDWKRLSGMADDDIRSAIRSDPDATPEADVAWLRKAKLVIPWPKKAVSIRLDRDITECSAAGEGLPDPDQRRPARVR
jgi:hypothetical protein